jgi:deazaflavin-dependent oxidoreductase (nitroreductase family)
VTGKSVFLSSRMRPDSATGRLGTLLAHLALTYRAGRGEMSETDPTFVRQRPNPLLRFTFRLPPLVYHGPIAAFLASRCVLRLTTTGRKSGLPRTVCVSFMPLDDHLIIFSGFGIQSNWYRNIRANPEATVQIGRQTMRARAAVVADPARRKELMLRMQQRSRRCGPPTWIRPLLRVTRAFDYDAEIQLAVDQAAALPVVELTPIA